MGLEEAKKIYGSTGGFGGTSGSAGVSTGLSTGAGTVARTVYSMAAGTGSTGAMPPPVKKYVPNVPSSYSTYDTMNGHNLPVNMAGNVQQIVSTYPPPPPMGSGDSSGSYGAQYNYPTTNYNPYNNTNNSTNSGANSSSVSTVTRTHYLDGQGWYNQTASRAVNQVIERKKNINSFICVYFYFLISTLMMAIFFFLGFFCNYILTTL